jgi:hypothetical protein
MPVPPEKERKGRGEREGGRKEGREREEREKGRGEGKGVEGELRRGEERRKEKGKEKKKTWDQKCIRFWIFFRFQNTCILHNEMS